MKKPSMPRFSSGILCNTVSTVNNAIECGGLFTAFVAWAFPTTIRQWFLVMSVFDLPIGKSGITISIAAGKTGTGRKTTLATVDIERKGEELGTVLQFPLIYKFQKAGYYCLIVNLRGSTRKQVIPCKVHLKDWPEFSRKELELLRSKPSIPSSIRTDVNCSECGHTYHLEESVLPEHESLGGVESFPETGIIECDTCGHEMHVKDIQGQIRDSIKAAVTVAKVSK